VKDPAVSGNAKEKSFRLLERYLPWLPPAESSFDLSGVKLADLDLPGLRLHVPNFTQTVFIDVDFRDAKLFNAPFIESQINWPSDLEERDTTLRSQNVAADRPRERKRWWSNFSRAELRFAQFQKAKIASTSFAGAELYRATFDEAHLCDVDFSGADLRRASFREVIFGPDFARGFKNTAWWLASGWNAVQMAELALQDHDALRESAAFQADKKRNMEDLAGTQPGTYERARVLNNVAWTLATYGIDLADAKGLSASSEESCVKTTVIPDNALDAARQAVCIVKALNETGEEKGKYATTEANFKDSLGYILLQTNRVREAATYLQEASKSSDDGELIFRYAVAQWAVPDKQREALQDLNTALDVKEYLPTHELQRLKDHITGEFKTELDRRIRERRPPPQRGQEPCPPTPQIP
jgi:uncharacterized protein YjbI with pentapeptide repeats